jgi:hypothetical protein
VAVAETLSFTIKMADQEDIVLRRWESRLLRVAMWIVELTYNFTSVGSRDHELRLSQMHRRGVAA